MQAMSAWQTTGSHRYRTEGDTVFWQMVDVLDEVDIEHLLGAVDAVLSRSQHVVLLVDCAQAHGLKAEARRRYGEWLKHSPYSHRVGIFYAVSGEMRTFLLLAQRSGELLSGRRSAIEIVEDEAAARQRADELRAAWTATS